jgi:hypothetical protein
VADHERRHVQLGIAHRAGASGAGADDGYVAAWGRVFFCFNTIMVEKLQ